MKVAYVFTEVPDLSGAFPGAELREMAARGLQIEIFILRGRKPKTEEGLRIEARFKVHRSPYFLSIRLIGAVLAASVRHPILLGRTILETVRSAAASPKILVKALAILPKSIRFASLVRQGDVALIHAYWASLPALAASVMARFSGLPYTMWAHAGADIYNKNHQTDALLRARLCEAARVFTCNRVNLEHFAQLAGRDVLEKVTLLTHGVDLEQFRAAAGPGSAARPVLLAVGRLTPAKGFDVLIRACALLRDRGYDFACRIVGTGVMESELHRLVDSLRLSGTVQLPGHVDHSLLPDLYREAAVFVAPSVIGPKGSRDGLPNVLLEAMAAGVACVGSRSASIPEVIEDGVTGLLAEPGREEPLADALARLLDDLTLRRDLATAGAALVAGSYDRKRAMDRLYGEFMEIRGGGTVRVPEGSA